MKAKWLLFSASKEKLSIHAKQTSPPCHCITCDKYLLSSRQWKQRQQLEQPLWLWVLSGLAKLQPMRLSKFKTENCTETGSNCFPVSETLVWHSCALWSLTVPALCWIRNVPKRQALKPIRDTWLVGLIRSIDIVSIYGSSLMDQWANRLSTDLNIWIQQRLIHSSYQ